MIPYFRNSFEYEKSIIEYILSVWGPYFLNIVFIGGNVDNSGVFDGLEFIKICFKFDLFGFYLQILHELTILLDSLFLLDLYLF